MAVQQVRSNTSSILENRHEIAAIRSDIAELKEANSTIKLRQAVSEAMSGQQGGLLSAGRFTHPRNNLPPPFAARAKCAEQEISRIKKYGLSRSALRVWPIPGESPANIIVVVAARDFQNRGPQHGLFFVQHSVSFRLSLQCFSTFLYECILSPLFFCGPGLSQSRPKSRLFFLTTSFPLLLVGGFSPRLLIIIKVALCDTDTFIRYVVNKLGRHKNKTE